MEKTCEFFDVPLELESYEIACYDLLRVMIENAGLQEQKLELAQELSRLVDHPLVIKDPRIVNLLETQISPTFGSLSLKRSSTKLNWVLDKVTTFYLSAYSIIDNSSLARRSEKQNCNLFQVSALFIHPFRTLPRETRNFVSTNSRELLFDFHKGNQPTKQPITSLSDPKRMQNLSEHDAVWKR